MEWPMEQQCVTQRQEKLDYYESVTDLFLGILAGVKFQWQSKQLHFPMCSSWLRRVSGEVCQISFQGKYLSVDVEHRSLFSNQLPKSCAIPNESSCFFSTAVEAILFFGDEKIPLLILTGRGWRCYIYRYSKNTYVKRDIFISELIFSFEKKKKPPLIIKSTSELSQENRRFNFYLAMLVRGLLMGQDSFTVTNTNNILVLLLLRGKIHYVSQRLLFCLNEFFSPNWDNAITSSYFILFFFKYIKSIL